MSEFLAFLFNGFPLFFDLPWLAWGYGLVLCVVFCVIITILLRE